MELGEEVQNANSPRGPIHIDAATRDIVQNEYIREVRKVGGQLATVEIETTRRSRSLAGIPEEVASSSPAPLRGRGEQIFPVPWRIG